MRTVGVVLFRLGRAIAFGAIVAGLLLAAYALAAALNRLHDEGFAGAKEALTHFLLYPVAAAVAGGLVAVSGVVLMYLAQRALDRGERELHDGVRRTGGTR